MRALGLRRWILLTIRSTLAIVRVIIMDGHTIDVSFASRSPKRSFPPMDSTTASAVRTADVATLPRRIFATSYVLEPFTARLIAPRFPLIALPLSSPAPCATESPRTTIWAMCRAFLHGEMDALENAGRQPASVYRESILYTTLSPCSMCSGAILLYGIRRVIIGENQTSLGEEDLLRARGVELEVVQDAQCIA